MIGQQTQLKIRRRLSVCLLLSGIGALIMEMAWIRYFQWIFGVATHSTAVVLGIYMIGLALGGIFWGNYVQRSDNPVALLQRLLLGVSMLGIAGVAFFFAMSPFTGNYFSGQAGIVIWLLKFLFTGLVVFPATFCMGGTLPVATWLMLSEKDSARPVFGGLSFFNLLGSCLGALLITFILIESFGYWISFCIGCTTVLAALLPTIGMDKGLSNPTMVENTKSYAHWKQIKCPYTISAFLAGIILFGLELLWYRLLTPLTGGSAFAMGIIFANVLLGLALGGEFSYIFNARTTRNKPMLVLVFLTLGSVLSASYWIGDSWALLASWAFVTWPIYPAKIIGWLVLSGLLVIPASILVGMVLPIAFVKIQKGRKESGSDSGILLAAHSSGALAGSLLFGFYLITWLGVVNCMKLLALLSLVTGLLLLIYYYWQNKNSFSLKPILIALAIIAINVLMLAADGPTAAMRHSAIGFGRMAMLEKSALFRKQMFNRKRRGIIWERDGLESSLAIDGANGLSLIINGQSDGNVVGDAPTQIMSGLIGAILHPEPRRAFVVGLGTGCSAGWLGAVKSIEKVDVAEIEPLVVEMASRSWDANQNVMNNPKVHLHFGDARAILGTATQTYDLIFSEPSHPYRAGMAGLFSLEFFRIVDKKLTDKGIFTHFAPGYGVDKKTFAILYATLLKVFPVVDTWQTQAGDMFLLCRKKRETLSIAEIRARLMKQPFRDAINFAWKTDNLEGFLSKFIGNTDLARRVTSENLYYELNTDDRPLLELGYAKCVGKPESPIYYLRKLSVNQGFCQPSFLQEKIDHTQVFMHIPTLFTLSELQIPIQNYAPSVAQRGTIHNAYLKNKFDAVVDLASKIPLDDSTIIDRLIIGHSLIYSPHPEKVIDYLQSLPGPSFPEGYFLLASYHFRCGHFKETLDPLLQFFAAVARNPWVFRPFIVKALDLSVRLAEKAPFLAQSLYKALCNSFAGRCLDEARRLTLLEIIPANDIEKLVEVFLSFEPFPILDERFLKNRLRVYNEATMPLAKNAAMDLQTFRKTLN
jgi:spermidine synthase